MRKTNVKLSKIGQVTILVILMAMLSSCYGDLFPPSYTDLFSQEANQSFLKTINVSITPDDFEVKVSNQFIKRDGSASLWFDNRTNKTLWFPNTMLGVNAYTYDTEAKLWHPAQLFILVNPEHQRPTPVESGCHGPTLVTMGVKLSPGPIRLLYIGSTDPQNPGVSGQIYANYVDIQVLAALYEPHAYEPVVQRC